MQDKEDHKNRKKMNTLELLYNKALMKAAADNAENVKKTKVWLALLSGLWAIDELRTIYADIKGGSVVLSWITWAGGLLLGRYPSWYAWQCVQVKTVCEDRL